jgi:outer membrane protein OmpA-like peptidoglycan-associated protein
VVVNVVKRPNVCPDVRLSANMTTVREGELVTFTAMANDPDNGPGPISYNWATTAGSVRRESADNVVSMDTTGLGDTTITVSVTVSDGDPNCADTESLSVVVEKKEMPVLVPISPCPFPKNSARIDNACKQILDDCAIRMQNDPRLILVIDGHSAAKERAGIALKRAENARAYLVNEKGIDANRITTRTYDDKCSVGTDRDNRRVEMNLVPPGLTADDIQKNCVTP